MSVSPTLGRTLLSRDAINRAEAQLQPEAEGVRDEIGFLAGHQAYADSISGTAARRASAGQRASGPARPGAVHRVVCVVYLLQAVVP